MRGSTRFALALVLIVFVVLLYRSYRIQAAAREAAQYAPAAVEPILLPAGTAIEAVFGANSIPESATAGDEITALVRPPIVVNGTSMIGSGGRLTGTLEHIVISGSEASLRIKFTALHIRDRVLNIQARPVVATAPVESDIVMVGEALSTLMGASLGASIGASSGDENLVDQGLVEGLAATTPTGIGIPIRVILIRDLRA